MGQAISQAIDGFFALFQDAPKPTNDTLLAIMEANEASKAELVADTLQKLEALKAELEAAKESEQAAIHHATEARKKEAGIIDALKEAQKENSDLRRGIRPVVMPTKEQYEAALKGIDYNAQKFHFAVCGTSGSGKSSLINAFRCVSKGDKNVAAVGVTETTSQITRYPDPRSSLPYSRFVWYDIPGAGTTAVSDWQYFNAQGLFAFDFIVLVYDVRFTKIDVSIIENCYRFNIPVFVVRSKSDQHIDNMLKELEIVTPPGSEQYEEIKARYVLATRSDFDKHVKTLTENPSWDERDRKSLLGHRVYLVSAINVRSLLSESCKTKTESHIDESLLIEDLLMVAARRRYPEDKCNRFNCFWKFNLPGSTGSSTRES